VSLFVDRVLRKDNELVPRFVYLNGNSLLRYVVDLDHHPGEAIIAVHCTVRVPVKLRHCHGGTEKPIVVEQVRHASGTLRIFVTPGSAENTGMIIGRHGARIERVRALVNELAEAHGLTVFIKVLTPDRPVPDATPTGR